MSESYVLKNYMEHFVAETAPKIMESAGICQCENCQLDVMAIALNSLSPKYVVTKQGELFTKLNIMQNQFEVDILTALSKAIEVVKQKPRH